MKEYDFNTNEIRDPVESSGFASEYTPSGEAFRGSKDEYFPENGRETFEYAASGDEESSAKDRQRKNRQAKQLVQKMGYLVASCVAVVMLATAVPAWSSDFKWSSGNSPDSYYSDYVTAIVCDAVDRSPVPARMTFYDEHGNQVRSARANNEGEYDVTLPEGEYTVELSATGYVDDRLTFYQSYDGRVEQVFAMSAKLKAGQMRIVLQWGENPSDLDSHLFGEGSNNTYLHVFYSDMYGYSDNYNSDGSRELLANLDVDDTSSYGPETITIYDLNTSYIYAVYDYSSGGSLNSSMLAESGATIKVYTYGSSSPKTFTLPSGNGTWWHVFRIDNGVITPINTMSTMSPTNNSGFFGDFYVDETPDQPLGIDDSNDYFEIMDPLTKAWIDLAVTDISYGVSEVPYDASYAESVGYEDGYFDDHRAVAFRLAPNADEEGIEYWYELTGSDGSDVSFEMLPDGYWMDDDTFFVIEKDVFYSARLYAYNTEDGSYKELHFADLQWSDGELAYEATGDTVFETW